MERSISSLACLTVDSVAKRARTFWSDWIFKYFQWRSGCNSVHIYKYTWTFSWLLNGTTDNLEWYGFDGGAPQPPDGLTTVEVDDIQIDLPEEVTLTLNQEINPLETSNVLGMDVYRRALQLVENLLANQQ